MKDYKQNKKKNPGIYIYIQNTLDFCSRFSVIVMHTSYIHCSIAHVDNRATLLGGILQVEALLTVCFNDLSVFTDVEIP